MKKPVASALASTLLALAFAPSAFGSGPSIVNRCADPRGAVWIAAVERGGSCEGCLAKLDPAAPSKRYLKRLALGERASFAGASSDAPRFYAYPVGRFRAGVEAARHARLEIVASPSGHCVVKAISATLAAK